MKVIEVTWVLVLMGAVIVVGIMQWLKTFLKEKPSWMWGAISLVLSFAVAAVMQFLPSWILLGMLVMSVGQLGYENIIQLVRRKLDSVKDAGGVK